MQKLNIDRLYLKTALLELLAIPSPAGLTDEIVHYTANVLDGLDIPYQLTRRGTIRATLRGNRANSGMGPDCAIVAHLDTLGAMVRELKPNGRLALAPIGTWSSRWAEGGRVTLFTEHGRHRGSVLPLLASGHVYNEAVDTQPVNWDQLELRLDEPAATPEQIRALGIQVGDFVAFDANPEILDNGYVVSRHLDNKAGVAAVLAALKAVRESGASVPMDCHAVFTLTEEVGSGATAVIEDDVSEVIGIDIGPVAPGQGAREEGVTIPLMDSAGPHDYHLTRRLLRLCDEHGIPSHRDVFRFYHSDAGAAVSAGHDVRTALLCFGADASHGYERTHLDVLVNLAELLTVYIQSGPTLPEDRQRRMGSVAGFSHQLDPRQLTRSETPLPDAGELVHTRREGSS
ncbi:osmoprotectant NAGGN system M42 family peptidase [Cupriavidus cauae]|uniref:osmoprotectant NAGGN system M42 family peptidase n=1 Tax=Cupriavidus TaxID=106589 RepID=UPI0011EF23EF|nr:MULTISPECIES: osmoprotectant NAGGN system M42 family peptidase [Cupriavidus]KAA0180470.1 osmoprotectant NAGGN system M42 family peptidase [Cupriavidus gilardii]MCA7083785.1 osmoprotectant NAGGN system M42 family peptidase [Cupriavidus sp. DB3]UZN52292.1 osmoprotectant NAGGN system M42 family peptidase [Cupriavidus cauae]